MVIQESDTTTGIRIIEFINKHITVMKSNIILSMAYQNKANLSFIITNIQILGLRIEEKPNQ